MNRCRNSGEFIPSRKFLNTLTHAFFLSFSLTHNHTDTHAHTHTQHPFPKGPVA